MKTYTSSIFGIMRKAVALSIAATLLSTMLAFGAGAQQRNSQKTLAASLSQDQRILHVLNRLGFGARPGDIERVKAMGLDNYINQQLNPGSINDSVVEAK